MPSKRNAIPAGLAAVLLALVLASGASAATPAEQQADAILANVAAHVSHGFANYSTSYETDEQIIAAGGHVSVLCGQVSYLGARALTRAGIPVRFVGAFSDQTTDLLDVPAGVLESHAMIEVWTGAQWELYDLDGNVQPVDENGQPVTIQQFAAMPVRHYRTLATDALYDPVADQYPLYESQMIFGDHEGYYTRVLRTVTIQQGGYYVYAGPEVPFLAKLGGYVPVSREALDAWSAEPPPAPQAPAPVVPVVPAAAPAPTLAAVAPSVVAAPTPVVSATPATPTPVPAVAKPRPRFVTRIRHHRVFHVYGTGRNARWVYVRRARS